MLGDWIYSFQKRPRTCSSPASDDIKYAKKCWNTFEPPGPILLAKHFILLENSVCLNSAALLNLISFYVTNFGMFPSSLFVAAACIGPAN